MRVIVLASSLKVRVLLIFIGRYCFENQKCITDNAITI